MSDTGLAIYQPEPSGDLKLWRPPEQVLNEAQQAAASLQRIITAKPKKVTFNGEQYLELEDWETLAHFYGYCPKIESTEVVNFGDVRGFKACATLINERTGMVVSRAESMCLNDEENWGMVSEYEWVDVLDGAGKKIWDQKLRNGQGGYKRERVKVGDKAKPLFQLMSMAQTRACAKVCRNKLAWVAVLAGYRPTPAEEIEENTLPETDFNQEPPKQELPAEIQRRAPVEQASEPLQPRQYSGTPAQTRQGVHAPAPATNRPVQAPQQGGVRLISEPQARRFYSIWKQAGKTKEEVTEYLRGELGISDDRQMPASVYEQACAWAQGA